MSLLIETHPMTSHFSKSISFCLIVVILFHLKLTKYTDIFFFKSLISWVRYYVKQLLNEISSTDPNLMY